MGRVHVHGDTISIHALHEESDLVARSAFVKFPVISIHALHEESDQRLRAVGAFRRYFNPRSP